MLQFKQHLFGAVFFTNDVMWRGHYDIIYHPFLIDSQYLKMWGVNSSGIHLIEKTLSLEKYKL